MAVFTLNYVNIYTDYTYLEINSIFKIQKSKYLTHGRRHFA